MGDGKGKKGGGKGGAPPKPKAPAMTAEEKAAKTKALREAREAAQRKQKEFEQAHMSFLGNLTTFEASGITDVDWSLAEKQVLLPGGTTIFKMSDGKIASVRRVDSPAMEIMAVSLAKFLDIQTPPFRAVQPADAEYATIKEITATRIAFLDDMPMLYEDFITQLKEAGEGTLASETRNPLVKNYGFAEPIRAEALLDLPAKLMGTVLVMEFQQGRPLTNLAGALSNEALHTLGRIAALAAVLNEVDMMPLPIWRESGELKHALKLDGKEDGSSIKAFDLRVSPIHSESLVMYAKRIQCMVGMLEKGEQVPDEDVPGWKKFDPSFSEEQIKNDMLALVLKYGFEIDPSNMTHYIDGLKAGLQAVASGYTSGELQKVLDDAEATASKTTPFTRGTFTAKECRTFLTATAGAIAGDMGPAAARVRVKLIGDPISQPVRTVRLLLEQAEIAHEFVILDILKGESKDRGLMEKWPAGQIPMLEDGDFRLGEASAILIYLCQSFNLTDWYPEDVKIQARINSWMHWHHLNTRKSTYHLLLPVIWGLKTNSTEVRAALDFIEGRLGERGPFLAGTSAPTIADLLILPEIDQIFIFKLLPAEEWPKIQEWLGAVAKATPKHYSDSTGAVAALAKKLGKG